MKKLVLALALVLSFTTMAFAGECGSGSWQPSFIRMGSYKVYMVNGNGSFTPINNWNDVTKMGWNVSKAQGQTCGCTTRSVSDKNYHPNSICASAYRQGLK